MMLETMETGFQRVGKVIDNSELLHTKLLGARAPTKSSLEGLALICEESPPQEASPLQGEAPLSSPSPRLQGVTLEAAIHAELDELMLKIQGEIASGAALASQRLSTFVSGSSSLEQSGRPNGRPSAAAKEVLPV